MTVEAQMAQRLMELQNPTGLKITTTWRKGTDANSDVPIDEQIADAAVLGSFLKWAASNPLYSIVDGEGKPFVLFKHKDDRDVAHFFTANHGAIISMLRSSADAFDFIARGADRGGDEALRSFAADQCEIMRNYVELFCRLGKTSS